MTPELENLLKLYELSIEAGGIEKPRALRHFRDKCRETALRTGMTPTLVEAHAIRAFLKLQASSARRTGRPHLPSNS